MATLSSNVSADIITYRLGGKLVYVTPAASYGEALDIAQKEFSEELGTAERSRIGFYIFANRIKSGAGQCFIRISEGVWPSALARFTRGEIIDIGLWQATENPTGQPVPLLTVPENESNPLPSRHSNPTTTTVVSRRVGRRWYQWQ